MASNDEVEVSVELNFLTAAEHEKEMKPKQNVIEELLLMEPEAKKFYHNVTRAIIKNFLKYSEIYQTKKIRQLTMYNRW